MPHVWQLASLAGLTEGERMGSLLRTVGLVAAALGLSIWLCAVPAAASSQNLVVSQIHDIQGAAHVSPFSGQGRGGGREPTT